MVDSLAWTGLWSLLLHFKCVNGQSPHQDKKCTNKQDNHPRRKEHSVAPLLHRLGVTHRLIRCSRCPLQLLSISGVYRNQSPPHPRRCYSRIRHTTGHGARRFSASQTNSKTKETTPCLKVIHRHGLIHGLFYRDEILSLFPWQLSIGYRSHKWINRDQSQCRSRLPKN